ncbi:MAG TPA: hypothetical protein VFA98_13260 [Thermoanaerobaculia bacterium]|jgi:hypothetical protein|nr:hypothetical protein [Thermoanaerobaculia bacterium]
MNVEYGWIKFTTKIAQRKPAVVYESRLTDFPEISEQGANDHETLARCFEKLAERIRSKK